MKGAHKKCILLEKTHKELGLVALDSGQFLDKEHRILYCTGEHARGSTLNIFLVSEKFQPVLHIYGPVSGQLGWTETYGYIISETPTTKPIIEYINSCFRKAREIYENKEEERKREEAEDAKKCRQEAENFLAQISKIFMPDFEPCECYHTKVTPNGTITICNGTKEQDQCSCKGDRRKCSFYPEVREKALGIKSKPKVDKWEFNSEMGYYRLKVAEFSAMIMPCRVKDCKARLCNWVFSAKVGNTTWYNEPVYAESKEEAFEKVEKTIIETATEYTNKLKKEIKDVEDAIKTLK